MHEVDRVGQHPQQHQRRAAQQPRHHAALPGEEADQQGEERRRQEGQDALGEAQEDRHQRHRPDLQGVVEARRQGWRPPPAPGRMGQAAQEEPAEAAEQAEIIGDVQVLRREGQQHGHRARHHRDGEAGEDAAEAQHPRGEGQIGRHLHADRPARDIPGIDPQEAQGMQQQRIGQDQGGRRPAGEGGVLHPLRAVGQPELHQFQPDQGQQHEDMQGPDTANAADQEIPRRGGAVQPVAIGLGHDEAAQHEEEIDEEEGMGAEGRGHVMPAHREVEERDHQRADAAPAVEDDEAPSLSHLRHPFPRPYPVRRFRRGDNIQIRSKVTVFDTLQGSHARRRLSLRRKLQRDDQRSRSAPQTRSTCASLSSGNIGRLSTSRAVASVSAQRAGPRAMRPR